MILSDLDIYSFIKDKGLKIEPFIESSVQSASVDLTLGSNFKVLNTTSPLMINTRKPDIKNLFKDANADPTKGIVLQGGEFALGHTIEKITIPDDIVGHLTGKSSLARLGLAIHITAGMISPGFSGQVTLELKNETHIPLILFPGMSIGQIFFEKLTQSCARPYGHTELKSKYQNQIGSTVSSF